MQPAHASRRCSIFLSSRVWEALGEHRRSAAVVHPASGDPAGPRRAIAIALRELIAPSLDRGSIVVLTQLDAWWTDFLFADMKCLQLGMFRRGVPEGTWERFLGK